MLADTINLVIVSFQSPAGTNLLRRSVKSMVVTINVSTDTLKLVVMVPAVKELVCVHLNTLKKKNIVKDRNFRKKIK